MCLFVILITEMVVVRANLAIVKTCKHWVLTKKQLDDIRLIRE